MNLAQTQEYLIAFCEIHRNSNNSADILSVLTHISKLLNLSAANVWRSCRSRSLLKNKPFLSSIGVNTAEIWPSETYPCIHADLPRGSSTGRRTPTRLIREPDRARSEPTCSRGLGKQLCSKLIGRRRRPGRPAPEQETLTAG